mmetsp:Transcript_7607/g.14900  ORF Transcript_7607/g.14900 Transcript_7607/m.14900 type:complete len:475 (+) Transcript_7607:328-1752(+)
MGYFKAKIVQLNLLLMASLAVGNILVLVRFHKSYGNFTATIHPYLPPPPLLVEKRTFLSAGYDARTQVDVGDGRFYWKWGEATEKKFQEFYDRVANPNPETCTEESVEQMSKQVWGLGSRIRDTQDMILTSLSRNKSVFHKGPDHCVMKDDSDNDGYMICLYEKWSSCQGKVTPAAGARMRSPPDTSWQNFLEPWWKTLTNDIPRPENLHLRDANGIVPNSDSRQPSVTEMLPVIRSLLMKSAFHPAKLVRDRVQELEALFQPKMPMLLVHLRRGDKWTDSGDMLVHEDMAKNTPIETMKHVHALIGSVERLSGMQFESIFLMSDEPETYADDAKEYLASALKLGKSGRKVPVYNNDFVSKSLTNNKMFKMCGHEALDSKTHQMLDTELLASMHFAVKYATYLVGYGSSGVSQIISQMLGAKYRMSPTALALYEDDVVLQKHLEETKDWEFKYLEMKQRDTNDIPRCIEKASQM